MRIKPFFTIALICVLITTVGCKKWLDVSPQTQVREKTLFETEQGFKDALTGVYIHLNGSSVYGQNLTMGFMDVLGQRYTSTQSSTHAFYRPGRYEYADASSKGYISSIWGGLYTGVANVNNILVQIDSKQSVFTGNNYNLIKGEALALRALVHFDLLRCFGAAPVVDMNRKSIPYVTEFGKDIYPLLTVGQVLDSCLRDLNTAETLLEKEKAVNNAFNDDPIRSYTRNHMNLWAVKGLKARLFLYKGDNPNALTAAQDVINNGGASFPFVIASEASRTSNRDRMYANELLFSLSTFKLNDYVNAYFKTTSVGGNPSLITSSATLTALFETTTGGSSDIRFNYLYNLFPSGYGTTKYYQDDYTTGVAFEYLTRLVPVIRLSEMYYIAAECSPITADGVNYLNIIRGKRGLANLATTISAATLEAEILKEYKKETYAEGQLFFYFKRKNAARVDGSSINMSDATWIFPLPENEVEFGKRF
jgi:starch-binding outer membrane protein, SusD/RagB family